MSEPLYLDDLHAGMGFTNGPVTLTSEEIKRFAREFDPQPFHLDEAAANVHEVFRGLAASGWHTAAVTMRLLVTGGMPLAGGYVGGGCELTWPRPVYAGDSISVHAEVLEVRPSSSKPDRGIVKIRSETRNQRGEVVQSMITNQVVRRRPDPGRAGS
jgi:acyl dehydratase